MGFLRPLQDIKRLRVQRVDENADQDSTYLQRNQRIFNFESLETLVDAVFAQRGPVPVGRCGSTSDLFFSTICCAAAMTSFGSADRPKRFSA